MESIRDEQKRMVRDRILEALASEIADRGLVGLSIPDVAVRAGVSQRTVYNYFENKDALVASLGAWSEEKMETLGGRLVEPDLEKVPEALVINFRLFSEMGPIFTAIARIEAAAEFQSSAMAVRSKLGARRTDAIRTALAQSRPDLDEEELGAATAIFRTLLSFGTWNRLANDFGLSGEDAGRVTAWAYLAMLNELKAGKGPFHEAG